MRARHQLLLALGASEIVRLSGWTAPLSLRAEARAASEAIAALVRDVEREPQLVPGVRRVTVIERGVWERPLAHRHEGAAEPGGGRTDGWVRYELEGVAYGLRWRVRIWKAWEGDRSFWWRAEGGTGWPKQHGAMWLLPHCTGTRMELRVRTRSALPALGGAATLLVNPLFLAPTFSSWLRNLARTAEG
jgi:hypothetical protein